MVHSRPSTNRDYPIFFKALLPVREQRFFAVWVRVAETGGSRHVSPSVMEGTMGVLHSLRIVRLNGLP